MKNFFFRKKYLGTYCYLFPRKKNICYVASIYCIVISILYFVYNYFLVKINQIELDL